MSNIIFEYVGKFIKIKSKKELYLNTQPVYGWQCSSNQSTMTIPHKVEITSTSPNDRDEGTCGAGRVWAWEWTSRGREAKY